MDKNEKQIWRVDPNLRNIRRECLVQGDLRSDAHGIAVYSFTGEQTVALARQVETALNLQDELVAALQECVLSYDAVPASSNPNALRPLRAAKKRANAILLKLKNEIEKQ